MNLGRPHPFVFKEISHANRALAPRILVIIRACSKAEAIRKFTRWRRDEGQQLRGADKNA